MQIAVNLRDGKTMPEEDGSVSCSGVISTDFLALRRSSVVRVTSAPIQTPATILSSTDSTLKCTLECGIRSDLVDRIDDPVAWYLDMAEDTG